MKMDIDQTSFAIYRLFGDKYKRTREGINACIDTLTRLQITCQEIERCVSWYCRVQNFPEELLLPNEEKLFEQYKLRGDLMEKGMSDKSLDLLQQHYQRLSVFCELALRCEINADNRERLLNLAKKYEQGATCCQEVTHLYKMESEIQNVKDNINKILSSQQHQMQASK
jgi:hypothetical protein